MFCPPEPIIRFAEIKYSIKEPQVPAEIAIVKIPVLRQGDTSKVSVVRIHTKDGSATSGEDYNPLSQGQDESHKQPNQDPIPQCLEILIYHDQLHLTSCTTGMKILHYDTFCHFFYVKQLRVLQAGSSKYFCLYVLSDVEFKEGETEHIVEIKVLYDGQREIREAFTVHMKPDEYMVAETQVRDHHLYKYPPSRHITHS